jgi:hypothetical protein
MGEPCRGHLYTSYRLFAVVLAIDAKYIGRGFNVLRGDKNSHLTTVRIATSRLVFH